MKKIGLVLVLLMMFSFGHARKKATNWQAGNLIATTNATLTAPYIQCTLFLKTDTDITITIKDGTLDLESGQTIDLWPLNFNASNTANITASTSANISYIWMENNE